MFINIVGFASIVACGYLKSEDEVQIPNNTNFAIRERYTSPKGRILKLKKGAVVQFRKKTIRLLDKGYFYVKPAFNSFCAINSHHVLNSTIPSDSSVYVYNLKRRTNVEVKVTILSNQIWGFFVMGQILHQSKQYVSVELENTYRGCFSGIKGSGMELSEIIGVILKNLRPETISEWRVFKNAVKPIFTVYSGPIKYEEVNDSYENSRNVCEVDGVSLASFVSSEVSFTSGSDWDGSSLGSHFTSYDFPQFNDSKSKLGDSDEESTIF